jgi:hypothetical protein
MSTTLAKPYKLTPKDKETASWLINAGQEDTERIARSMTGTEADVAILQHAISTEKAKPQPRSGRIKIMEGKLRTFLKAKPLPLQGESTGPDWSRARHLQERTKLAFRFALAGQILLGHELETLKIELGFMGSGRRKEKPHDAVFKSLNRTWDQWCRSEMNGMSPDTADRLIATYQAAKAKLKKLGGQPRLLSLLETKPDAMDAEDRNTLSGMVDKLEWAESQKQLLEEWGIAKQHKSTEGGDTTKPKEETKPTAQQMAFAFFETAAVKAAEVAGKIGSLRIKQDYEAFLYQLDVVSEDPKTLTLDVLEVTQEALIRDAQAFLADIKKAKAAKLTPAS